MNRLQALLLSFELSVFIWIAIFLGVYWLLG
jgi:UPF0716 family protein affecting phage T7 exclusion